MPNTTLKFRKVSTLPGSLAPSTMYMVTSADAGILELVVSSADGLSSRHIINKSEINTLISTAIAAQASGLNEVKVVADIAARNALVSGFTKPTTVLVLNAVADTSVASGAATYIYDTNTTTWYKISEAESLDLVLNWNSISGRPTSSPAQIDAAVTASHSHTNKTQLDKIGENGTGDITYNGAPVRAYLDEEVW
jgi:hypothetical protein